jgi:hypothetical protein
MPWRAEPGRGDTCILTAEHTPFWRLKSHTAEVATMEIAALLAILIVLLGILTALKKGFNEVIKALETVDRRLSESRHA